MRFEELAYTVDGLPVTVGFHARLTVMSLPAGEERAGWIARLLGVLEGVREGDGASLVYVDRAGRRIRLERDEHGGATLTDLAPGEELSYPAAHLSLDGRLDWFASVGATARRAVDAVVVGRDALAGDGDYDRAEAEARLARARRLLARVDRRRQAVTARSRQCGDLLQCIAELDERIDGEAGASSGGSPVPTTRVLGELESLASTCCALAARRDDLIARLAAAAGAGVLGELVEEVEPALADAMVALADASRPFGVTLGAARIGAAGVGAAGVTALTSEVLAEAAAAVPEVEPDSVGDRRRLEAERSRLIDELHRLERGLSDEAALGGRHSALERRIAALVVSIKAGQWVVPEPEAEAILRRLAEKARRVGRSREPLPLLVNDALDLFGPADKRSLLEVLSNLGETTQVVYLTDDADVLAWASSRAPGDIGLWRPDGVASIA